MTELEFCEHHCGKLSAEQTVWVMHHVERGTFVGIGKARGRLALMPLVKVLGVIYALTTDARTEPASTQGQILYNSPKGVPLV